MTERIAARSSERERKRERVIKEREDSKEMKG